MVLLRASKRVGTIEPALNRERAGQLVVAVAILEQEGGYLRPVHDLFSVKFRAILHFSLVRLPEQWIDWDATSANCWVDEVWCD